MNTLKTPQINIHNPIPTLSPRVRDICMRFGIPPQPAHSPQTTPQSIIADDCSTTIIPQSITLISGPSGAGKSTLLAQLAARFPHVIHVRPASSSPDAADPNAARPIIDLISPNHPLPDALNTLTAAGLGEPRLWLLGPAMLSDGQRFRFALARAIAESLDHPARPPIFCDEFAAHLHRRLARALACNLRKLATRNRLTLVLAAAHDDLADTLQPDTHIQLQTLAAAPADHPHSTPAHKITHHRAPAHRRTSSNRPDWLLHDTLIEQGRCSDYWAFAHMHYRTRDAIGFVDKVFVLRDTRTREPLGVVVYAHAPLELAMRNLATRNRFRRDATRLNLELRILRRLVLHPDLRGCGVAHWFVRRTLPRVGTRFVECLAAMGALNPVFQRAGMIRVGRAPTPRGRIKLLQRMELWNIDPLAPHFTDQVRNCPRVRELVLRTIGDWIKSTRSPNVHLESKPPAKLAAAFRQLLGDPPTYYLWDREHEFPASRFLTPDLANLLQRAAQAHSSDPRHTPAPPSDTTSQSPIDRHNPSPPPAPGSAGGFS